MADVGWMGEGLCGVGGWRMADVGGMGGGPVFLLAFWC